MLDRLDRGQKQINDYPWWGGALHMTTWSTTESFLKEKQFLFHCGGDYMTGSISCNAANHKNGCILLYANYISIKFIFKFKNLEKHILSTHTSKRGDEKESITRAAQENVSE